MTSKKTFNNLGLTAEVLEAINKKIEEKSTLRTDLEKKSAAYKQAVRTLLTDDQKVRLKELGYL